jgi:DNA-binding transcriptional regulator GbsR (MarR family)
MITPQDALHQSEVFAADAVGDVIEFWGFRKALGRLWTILFLSDTPLPADVIAERLQMSAGAVSMGLNELRRWAVVRRVWRPGQRREYFEAETDFWKMISKVVSERERFLIRSVRDRLENASDLLKSVAQTPEVRTSRQRLGKLLALVGVAQSVIDAFIVSRHADFTRFGNVLHLPQLARRARGEPRMRER